MSRGAKGVDPFEPLLAAEVGVGTAGAAVAVGGGREGIVGIEDLGNLFVQEVDEFGGVGGDVGDGFAADCQRGVVAFGSGVLDEDEGRTDSNVGRKMADG